MIDPVLYKKAKEKANAIVNKQPVPTPDTLKTIKEKRLSERELEKIAPSTGYPELDRIIKGFIPGHLYTLTGDTNVGKTTAASNFAVNLAKQGRKVLYVALEPDTMIIEYVASVYHDKRFVDVTPEDLELNDISIDIIGKGVVDSVERMVEVIQTYDRYDFIVIDHIGYFITKENNYLQQQSNAIKALVSVAKEKQTAIMIIAHLRKRGKNDKKDYVPTSDDISGSASFKQDSTEVMILTRFIDQTDEDKIRYLNEGKLFVTKTKIGANGVIKISFSNMSAKITTNETGSNEPFMTQVNDIFGA